MKRAVQWWKDGVVAIVAVLAGVAGSPAGFAYSAASPQAMPCAAPEYRQFDFWIGDWEVLDAKSHAKVANVRVDRVLDGCVLQEDYEGADGHKGQSFSIYDASRQVWHQSWVTNRGHLLTIEGRMKDNEMILSGADRTAAGQERRVRGIWMPADGGVRETAMTSTDGGKTWEPWFDLSFRRKTTSEKSTNPSAAEEAKTLAALDTQYQAAVKRNDETTMDRILADDFVLVTGSGKAYTKADLLKGARSGKEVYEHNEELEQTVRVWGDTAVVTAKLWEKGTSEGKAFDHTLWFSDTYVRTPDGWRYVFGQSSLPLP